MDTEQSHNILYNCLYQSKYGNEQIITENVLSYIQTGQIQFTTNKRVEIFRAGDIGLLRRNQLVKSLKMPDENGAPFKSISLLFDQKVLRQYSTENNIQQQGVYAGDTIQKLSSNVFIKSFFQSLVPYFDKPKALTQLLAELKIREAIELLSQSGNSYKQFLFDFSEPYKIDMEAFMVNNFQFNIPISEFARLTGRSLSTFKRDFKKIFSQTPEKWLKEQRLEKAHFLIAEKKQKPIDIYLQVGFENFSHFSASFKEKFGFNASTI